MTQDVISALESPDAANTAIQAALEPTVEPPPVIETPPDAYVNLHFGWRAPDGEVYQDAQVRELNGADEEAISRVPGGRAWRLLHTILDRGVVKLGSVPCTPAILDDLTLPDCDELLLAIRAATYGDEVEFKVVCQACEDENEVKLSIKDDIPRTEPKDREFTVQLGSGPADVSLPTRAVQKAVLKDEHRTLAEANTVMLSRIVTSLNYSPVVGSKPFLYMPVRDREKLVSEIAAHTAGPRLEEVTLSCANCSENIPVPLTMADLFRL